MARRLDFTREAVADLDNIWMYTLGHWGQKQTRAYLSELGAECRAMAGGNALVTKVRIGADSYIRCRHRSHVIFAVESAEALLIVRVLHVKQDIETHLF